MHDPAQWQTLRLLIRRFRAEDLDGLYAMHADAEATKYIGGVWTMDKARHIHGAIIASYVVKELEWLAVEEKQSGNFIGVCWLGKLNKRWAPPGEDDHVELGYRYDRRYWGRGYATEAGERMLRRGFEELGLRQIVGIVNPENLASERVLKKLGMNYRHTYEQEGLTINFYTLAREAMKCGG